MHSNQAQNLYECLTNAYDAMLNMIIAFGSLQILPPLEESCPEIQQKLEKGDGRR